jgi:uncharacterized protein (TIGR02996 family)
MADTLESLNRAVIANPRDRTVRLVYADALDETGDPVHAARAEFIRVQIEGEALPESDLRRGTLLALAETLFERHWLEWWRPVYEPAGLPEPHVPGRRRAATPGERRPRRPRHWPYFRSPDETTVNAPEYGFTVRFAGGFPEEVSILNLDTPPNAPRLVHCWGDVMPLVRLQFAFPPTPRDWKRVSGPHLKRLVELSFDRLPPDTARAVAASRHLSRLTQLSASIGGDAGAVRTLVASPAWRKLQVLRFTGPLSPDAVRELAQWCRLKKLEDLELTLGNPADPFGALGMIGTVLGQVFQSLASAFAFPSPGGLRWAEFGPALEALAGAVWVGRLRRLRIASGQHRGLATILGARLAGTPEHGADRIPDAAVLALAAALDRRKLELLTLPKDIVSPAARKELEKRLGSRVAFE